MTQYEIKRNLDQVQQEINDLEYEYHHFADTQEDLDHIQHLLTLAHAQHGYLWSRLKRMAE